MDKETQTLVKRARRLLEKVRTSGKNASLQDIGTELVALRDAADRLEQGAPQTKRIPYKSQVEKRMGRDGEEVETHESFGVAGFSRISGSMHLFGSNLDNHGTAIAFRVKRAERCHSLSQDWIHGHGQPIVEIVFSAAQFAEAITMMNMGDGVPCTIRSVEGVMMEPVPDEVVAENVKIRENFKDNLGEIVANLKQAEAQVNHLVDSKATISKGRAKEIAGVLSSARATIESNTPFILRQFQESTQKVVTQAKAEVEAFVSLALRRAGVEHIKQLSEVKVPLLSEENE